MNYVDLIEILLKDVPSIELRKKKEKLAILIPEFRNSFDFDQKNIWHPYDVFEHTLRVIDSVDCDIKLRIAALFHDVGKPYTMTMGDDGNGHFYGHWEKSKEIFNRYKENFYLNNEEIGLVCNLIEYHDLSISTKSIDTFIDLFNKDDIELLFSLKKADILAQNMDFSEKRLLELEKQKKLYYSKVVNKSNNSFFNRLEQIAKSKAEFRSSLKKDDTYIRWLEKFTLKNGNFDTDMLTYDSDRFSDTDKENIKHIETLFEIISEFAGKNYLLPINDNLEIYYCIKYGDSTFHIGADYGQAVSFYCTKSDELEEGAISYEDIVKNEKSMDSMRKDEKLKELSKMIDTLFEQDNIPIEIIKENVEKTFQKIKNKELI